MNSAKWNWILLTILASHLILTSTADTHCSLNDDSTSMASWQSFFSLFAKASYDKCHSSSSADLGNLTSTIVKQLDEIKQLIQEERAKCQNKIEELNSSFLYITQVNCSSFEDVVPQPSSNSVTYFTNPVTSTL